MHSEITMPFDIRPFRNDDTEALVEIWRRSVRATHDFLKEEDFRDIEQKLATVYFPNVEIYVACSGDDRPVGFIGMNGRHIEMLFLDPLVMGLGMGRKLLEHVMAGDGPLTVDVNAQNPKAVGFYVHCGFVPTGRSETDSEGRAYPLLHLAMVGDGCGEF